MSDDLQAVTPVRHSRHPSNLAASKQYARGNMLTITEQQFTNYVLAYAKSLGWRCHHVRTSGRMSNGVAIPTVQGDKGFPDLVMVGTGTNAHRIIFAELKVGKNKPTPEQDRWLGLLGGRNAIECYLWRPADWSDILKVLMR